MGKYKYINTYSTNWIKKTPAHWREKVIKRHASLIYGDNLPQEARVDGVFNVFGSNGIVGKHEDYNTEGETIIIGRKGSAGALNYNPTNSFVIDTAFYIDRNSSNCNLKWLYYVLSQLELTRLEKESPVPGLGREQVLYRYIVFPPLPEQKAIADYLDKACHRIDKIIEIKEKQLEKMEEYFSSKLKEIITSGVEENTKKKKTKFDWFNEIPKHWKVVRLKHILSKANGGVTPKGGATSYVDEGVPFIRSQNIRFDKLDLSDVVFITKDTHDKMSNSKLESGDVLLNITGASLGRCYYYDCEKDANVNQHVCILRPFQFIRTKFLYYVLRSEIGQAQIFSGFKGSGREGLSAETIKRFSIPLPTKEEQKVIENHIDILSTNIQDLKDQIYNQITILQSYRKSLIHECVTGKKQVWEGEIEKIEY